MQTWRDGFAANKFNPWGKRCAEVLHDGGAGRRAVARRSLAAARARVAASLLACSSQCRACAAQDRRARGASTSAGSPRCTSRRTTGSRTRCSTARARTDTFPWLAAAAPARAHRDRAGRDALSRVGRAGRAGVGRGDRVSRVAAHRDAGPRRRAPTPATRCEVLRHELAHLALHEALGDLPPRWFDEGYASCRRARVAARRGARDERRARARAGAAVARVARATSFVGRRAARRQTATRSLSRGRRAGVARPERAG